MKNVFMTALVVLLSTAGTAGAACTAEEAQEKAQQFMDKAMQLAQKNPDKYADVAQAMQSQLPELQKINDLEGLCKFYDEWATKMQ